jgi:hypothetical protein
VYLIFRNRLFRDAVAAILTAHLEIKLLGATDQPDRAASEIAALALEDRSGLAQALGVMAMWQDKVIE